MIPSIYGRNLQRSRSLDNSDIPTAANKLHHQAPSVAAPNTVFDLQPSTSAATPYASYPLHAMAQANLAITQPKINKQNGAYFAAWDMWARAPGTAGEQRAEAVKLMKAWFTKELDRQNQGIKPTVYRLSSQFSYSPVSIVSREIGLMSYFCEKDFFARGACLHLNDLHLTSLPERLPDILKNLDISNNQLIALPEHLPPGLMSLQANNNQLTALPVLPPHLGYLDISNNQLTSLPDLPSGLRVLHASENVLTSLPDPLPEALVELNVFDNRLRELPEDLPRALEYLDASKNELETLPDLPEHLKRLDVSHNRLDELPDPLPPHLVKLCAAHNVLTGLPDDTFDLSYHYDPPLFIEKIDLSHNQITKLPDPWPPKLRKLRIENNQLRDLPDGIPNSIEKLHLENNQLTDLPDEIYNLGRDLDYESHADNEIEIYVEGNPLSAAAREDMHATLNAPNYDGPTIHFSMGQDDSDLSDVRPLEEAVSRWYTADADDLQRIQNTWAQWKNDPHADEFSKFLGRLQTVKSALKHGEAFSQKIGAWLDDIATKSDLRKHVFQLAGDALGHCEDRVAQTFITMQREGFNLAVAQGEYDNELGELMPLARQMFRLEELDKLAYEKARSLHFVDEVEVYLAYPIKLREQLGLDILDTVGITYARFLDVSHVTDQDLQSAAAIVRQNEEEKFDRYLASDWAPWQAVLQRQCPEAYAHAQNEKSRLADSEEFSAWQEAYLAEHQLENNEENRLACAQAICNDIAYTINHQLTTALIQRSINTPDSQAKNTVGTTGIATQQTQHASQQKESTTQPQKSTPAPSCAPFVESKRYRHDEPDGDAGGGPGYASQHTRSSTTTAATMRVAGTSTGGYTSSGAAPGESTSSRQQLHRNAPYVDHIALSTGVMARQIATSSTKIRSIQPHIVDTVLKQYVKPNHGLAAATPSMRTESIEVLRAKIARLEIEKKYLQREEMQVAQSTQTRNMVGDQQLPQAKNSRVEQEARAKSSSKTTQATHREALTSS